MTATVSLRGRFRGELIMPGDTTYDERRAVWNGAIDRRPSLIARCSGVRDVQEVVRFAREGELLVSVRGGGHNIAGLAVWDDAVMIDVSALRTVRVDPRRRTARAHGGALWGDYDYETQVYGWASPGGLNSTTGIAGFTLGGGFGWLSRLYGLACDNLLEADVVGADGELIRAAPDENADLFWGLRGGGGNFGIVTSFEYRLHPVGPNVLCGMLFFAEEQIADVLRVVREFGPAAPRQLFVAVTLRIAPSAPFLPQAVHGTKVIAVGCLYAGSIEEGERVLKPLRRSVEPIAETIEPRRYTVWQQALDANWTRGFDNYWKAEYLASLSDEVIEVVVEHFGALTSPLSDIKIGVLGGGAIADVPSEESAYTHRAAPFILNINTRWDDGEDERHIAWTRDFWEAARPFSAGGVYVNFLGQEGAGRVLEAYGAEKFERLVALKRRFDPTNFFRINQNIPPS
ncbi:MAG TPA: FAD-binding oxidoreductase [Gaiellaceae bacterium]